MSGVLPPAARALAAAVVLIASSATSSLQTPGFRAVGVALSRYPVSAMAVAPDGRLFVAVQALGASGASPTTAEIRVYSSYSTNDGSVFDEGSTWATVDNVRATTNEEGLLGLALAPDFASSKLVYVYLNTTDESVNQHVRVYKENGSGLGDLVGAVMTTLEPPTESTTRNGGALAFGADGCLYAGVGDNGSGNRWNAQLLLGTDPIQGSENTSLCTKVCLGTTLYPTRTVTNNGALNQAGKLLRLAVEGGSPARPGPANLLSAQPDVFSAGFRNPTSMAVHPLTGQLYVSERGDTQQAEINIADNGSNQGWPCLEGTNVAPAGVAACLSGHTANEVYSFHPEWRRPIATHAAAVSLVATGLTAYTGLAYPADYYGDVFYLLRDSARIYRLDLQPPCFLPHPNGVTPTVFHDSASDGDFTVFYDQNGDSTIDQISMTNLMAMVQGPDPSGQKVLYVAGKQGNGNALTDDTVIFRIEYATAFTPYGGDTGRVASSCFTDGVYSGGSGSASYSYDNPFLRMTCLPPGGACPGQPDGTACDDGDVCNGAETCQGGVCTHGGAAADGTPCNTSDQCREASSCTSGTCVVGAAKPDGTGCSDGNPCNGVESCSGAACQASSAPGELSISSLTVSPGLLSLQGMVHPAGLVYPNTDDALFLSLTDSGGTIYTVRLDHPDSDSLWRRAGATFQYKDRRARANGIAQVKLRRLKGGNMDVRIKGRRLTLDGLDEATVVTRFAIGEQCFVASPSCSLNGSKLHCP